MKVTLMLADAAQAVGNKLYILGGGWSIQGPAPTPLAIAIKIDVPWDETNQRHVLRIDLVDADGAPVVVDTADGPQPFQIQADFEVGRPVGLRPGTPIDIALALSIPPLPLAPGRYEFRLTVGDRSDEDWRLPFTKLAEGATAP